MMSCNFWFLQRQAGTSSNIITSYPSFYSVSLKLSVPTPRPFKIETTSFQAHNDLMRTYEAKLSQFGIPTEELGFRPLESTVGGQPLGQGPAGLVAAPN